MFYVLSALQLITALGIFNVWILRRERATDYRGGGAKNMQEEFAVYGLPSWSFWVIGTGKIACATLLLLGFFIPTMGSLGAGGLAVFMLGAFALHLKVKDPMSKAVPSLIMLVMCLAIAFLKSPTLPSVLTNGQ